MKILRQFITGITLTALVFSCREAYTPPQITANSNYLVVEGLINTGTDSTIFKLSRTVRLYAKTTTQNETHAIVTVESDANAVYPLKEITPGTYASAALGLSKTAKYRLRIIANTNTHTTYLSDFTAGKDSPLIDSLGYNIEPNGLQVYVNAHDATNNTRYYRWDYVETWEFHPMFDSQYVADQNGTACCAVRTPAQDVFTCWHTSASTDLVLASSAKLTQDVIYNTIITTVPSASEKVSVGYSIFVKQYALTLDAFNFWQNLKKNTELLGSIFDAQPSEIQGNIHNITDSTEPVFGYVSAGTSQQKRITVFYTSWPQGWGQDKSAYNNCLKDTILNKDIAIFLGGAPNQIPLEKYYIPPFPAPQGYVGSSRNCADCTLRGTNIKPSFWPL